MKAVMIQPYYLNGKVKIPPSKSLCHRAIIAAALSKGECVLNNINMSLDIMATCKIMEKLGAKIRQIPKGLIISGKGVLQHLIKIVKILNL